MLPVVSSIYNLLGLMPPSILKGRRALYKLCSKKFNWNEPNNKNVKKLWQKRQSELKLLKNIKLMRCYKPTELGKVVSFSLNYFLDALQRALDQTTHVIFTEIIQQNQNYLWQLPYINLQAKSGYIEISFINQILGQFSTVKPNNVTSLGNLI